MKKPDITHFIMIAENLGFSVNENGYNKSYKEWNIELNQKTPAGEDWWFDFSFKDPNELAEKVGDLYEGFDVDDEVELWIEGRGQRGVPSSIRTLVEDAEWKEEKLKQLYNALDSCPIEENQANRLLRAIKSRRFNHERYLQKRLWNNIPIQTEPLHCSYGTIGFSLSVYDQNFLQYDWELKEITLL